MEENNKQEFKEEIPDNDREEMRNSHKLYKSSSNIILTGTCGGLAEYLRVSPFFIRLLFIITSLFGGWGIVAYILAAILIPRSPEDKKHNMFLSLDSKRIFGLILIAVGFYFSFKSIGLFRYINLFGFVDSILLPVAFIAVSIWILIKGRAELSVNVISKNEKLFRSIKDRRILGLCGGLAVYFDSDANLIRMLWLLFSFITIGFGIVFYFIIAYFIPAEIVEVENAE